MDDEIGKCVMRPAELEPEPEDGTAFPVLTRDAILEADDIGTRPLDVPEWGGRVFLRILSGKERDSFELSLRDGKTGRATLANFRARFAAVVLCDAQGARLFRPADIPKLGQKSAAALDRVLEAGKRLSGMTDEDVEEMVGNSDSDPSDECGSA